MFFKAQKIHPMKAKTLILVVYSLMFWACTEGELSLTSLETEVDIRTIKFEHSRFSDALNEAKETRKPLLLYFTIEDCSWSAKMEEEVFTDPEVQRLVNEKFICSKIHLKKSPETPGTEEFKKTNESKLNILSLFDINASSCPAFAIIDFNGELKKKETGYMDVQEFIRFGRGE